MASLVSDQQRFFILQFFILTLGFAVLWLLFPVAGTIDLQLIHPFMDQTGHFPLKRDWALAELNHRYVKDIIIAVYVIYLLKWLASYKWATFKPQRWQNGYFIGLVLISTSLIGILKSQSAHACPWDMTLATTHDFFWDLSASAGHCFPGGHAATGFALFVGYFVYRLNEPKRAWFYLLAALILGFVMGWAQMMRGAHFLSHNLWTAWVIWLVNVLAYALCYKQFTQPSPNQAETTA
ncbi:MAG: phosphatase PAP2 family protein [Acinetobacter sp.]